MQEERKELLKKYAEIQISVLLVSESVSCQEDLVSKEILLAKKHLLGPLFKSGSESYLK